MSQYILIQIRIQRTIPTISTNLYMNVKHTTQAVFLSVVQISVACLRKSALVDSNNKLRNKCSSVRTIEIWEGQNLRLLTTELLVVPTPAAPIPKNNLLTNCHIKTSNTQLPNNPGQCSSHNHKIKYCSQAQTCTVTRTKLVPITNKTKFHFSRIDSSQLACQAQDKIYCLSNINKTARVPIQGQEHTNQSTIIITSSATAPPRSAHSASHRVFIITHKELLLAKLYIVNRMN